MKRGKCDGVVGQGMLRGSLRELGLAEGRRGLCRAQPVAKVRRAVPQVLAAGGPRRHFSGRNQPTTS